MRVMIGADLAPTAMNFKQFETGDMNALLGAELLHLLSIADYRIFNLERPLTDFENPIVKWGPCLRAPSKTIEAIKSMNVNLFTLANNHIMDQGKRGLQDTCNLLTQNGIDFVGVGSNLLQASEPYIFEKDGIKVGIYACAEHEFSIAEEQKEGANPFDPYESLDHIAQLKNQCDYVIVLYHGGKEHYKYPSPLLQKCCRKIIEKGADIVLTQHSHCIGTKEEYRGKVIVYGQGNFLYAAENKQECWDTGLLVDLQLERHGMKVVFHPLVRVELGVRLASNIEKEHILSDFEKRSVQIQDKDVLMNKYNTFAEEMFIGYESAMLGKIGGSFLFRALNKITGYRLIKKIFSGKNIVALYNALKCEAHYELLMRGIEERLESEMGRR